MSIKKDSYIGQFQLKKKLNLLLNSALCGKAIGEINLEMISDAFANVPKFVPLPKFAEEKRDLALVMSEEISCGAVEEAIKSSCKYITSVTLFDVYRSEQIGEGKKSMAFNILFTPDDHEFTGEEIDGYISKLLRKLSYTMQIEIR